MGDKSAGTLGINIVVLAALKKLAALFNTQLVALDSFD